MRLVTFGYTDGRETGEKWGVLDGAAVIEGEALLGGLAAAGRIEDGDPPPRSMREVLASWPSVSQRLRNALETEASLSERPWRSSEGTFRLWAPLQPLAIFCSGENYAEHLEEKSSVRTKEPEFFLKAPLAVTGPDSQILLDQRVTSKLDYEVEFAAVIGVSGRYIRPEAALDHVAGYTILNDVTARDRQLVRHDCGKFVYDTVRGKNFDTSAPLGPAIVTKDEVADPRRLQLSSRVNGEVRQRASTADMIWSLAEIVAYFSQYMTLQPGTVVSTGTPSGTAWGQDAALGGTRGSPDRPAPYLHAGDVVECEIERIGVLRNEVVEA
jgi:2-keto-4-pentenoate hydratase/2-oxohepta-3-ene-1,7-dioic acid hydratase in catechol pathway